ncbi:hypothetical protein BJ170DRAFT_598900 [Xylariales sp. AK1849]|nr:hypothetical protein BJ170DRAFT_598900 [Xylariales sp. AK1849]
MAARYFCKSCNIHNPARQARNSSPFWRSTRTYTDSVTTVISPIVPHLTAPDLKHASQRGHICNVHERLQQNGILKISLGFPDPDSQYLQQLVLSLHRHHDHRLPISHSASCGWFWDVRPNNTAFQTANHQARSETMEKFPWHTDCSYEDLPPRYFALHVLQHDRFGGGTLSVMNVQRLGESLSPSTRASLMRREYSVTIPLEFIKNPTKRRIVGSLMVADEEGQPSMIRFRRDLLTPLTERASRAMHEFDVSLQHAGFQSRSTVHLTSRDLPAGTIVLMDNRRWLHARNDIKDPKRHLRRGNPLGKKKMQRNIVWYGRWVPVI